MSNRLELEFPVHRWQAVPWIRREPMAHDVAEHHLARGRRIRSEAFRRTARLIVGAAGRALVAVAALLGRAAYGLAKEPSEHESRRVAARSA